MENLDVLCKIYHLPLYYIFVELDNQIPQTSTPDASRRSTPVDGPVQGKHQLTLSSKTLPAPKRFRTGK